MPTTTHDARHRYRSPLGDKREQAVPCITCHNDTTALDAKCDRCFIEALVDGDEVVFTTGPVGVLLGVEDSRFAGTINAGVVGIYRGRHPERSLGANWLIVDVDASLVATIDSEGIRFQDVVVAPVHAGSIAKVTA